MEKVITLDWLEICFITEFPVLNSHNDFKELDSKSFITPITNKYKKHSNCIGMLNIDNQIIGQVFYYPQTSKASQNSIVIKFENNILYRNVLKEYLHYITDTLGWKFQKINRIDIAIDSANLGIIDFINKVSRGKSNIRLKGKSKLNLYECNHENMNANGFSIGSITSDKQVTIYNKSKELLKRDKPYIEDYWKENSLDYINNEVERVELKLFNSRAKIIELNRIFDCNYLASICKKEFENFFQFEQKLKQNNKQVIKDVTPFNLDYFDTIKLNTLPLVKSVNSYDSIKKTIKVLYKESRTDAAFKENCGNTIKNLCDKYPLNDWYSKKVVFWECDHLKNKRG